MITFKKLQLAKEIITHTTSCLLDYPYFKGSYKMLAIDLSKQKAFNANPKAIQQVNFTANLAEEQTMFFLF